MAKRKRKMTLFDVINTGQPIGMQHRQRVPAYQPTPELPVTKKLAKLFGRTKPANGGRDGPLSAAEELERLRLELAGGAATTTNIQRDAVLSLLSDTSHAEPQADADAEPENDPTAAFFSRKSIARPVVAAEEPIAPTPRSPAPALTGAERIRAAAVAQQLREAASEPSRPRTPRKPIGEIARDAWKIAAPKLAIAGEHAAEGIRRTYQMSAAGIVRVREIHGHYAATLATAAGVAIVLGGSFYIGKLLLNRPATAVTTLASADGINGEPRPEVMDLTSARANEPIANVARQPTEARLERGAKEKESAAAAVPAQTPQTDPTVFGGRRPDQNYVIVQSYFTKAEADAAVDVLAKYNIKTTVEKNLPRWATKGRDLYSVVSAEGFTKPGTNDAYQALLATINKISDKETGSTLPKRLDPRPYRFEAAPQP